MNVSCNVIKDLIPLYTEDMLSDDSVHLVEKHLEHCDDCRKLLNELNQPYHAPVETDVRPLMKMKSALRKKKATSIALTFVFTLLFSALLFAFVTAPKYLPYSEELIQVSEQAGESIVVEFSEHVSGYDMKRYSSEGEPDMAYHLTTWTTIWEEYIQPNDIGTVVLNAEDETVSSVYYYQTDGAPDRLIYGIDDNPNGGIVTLPRLNLSYYLLIAILLGGLCLVIAAVFRQNKQIAKFSIKTLLLLVSYIIAHLIVRGSTSASYNSTRDLLAIILIVIPLYALILLGINVYSIRRERKQIEKLN
ncbi:zf-HC2 domain-containing protein [Alkalibacterium sp. 20]|uniref:zf-HC2 domain-containing protein n=1 Tax=Alkalibacterium sp. 20 TaxID=1798803 RepID=UPI0008FFF627|nr:zf-HC2 domain-containing protein [Alkalibacterium sp. 20]OJF94595.1 hypothetical protein AX762_01635 [Alkalibacterium sp. 20]